MVELETTLVPKLDDHDQKWKRFVDGTFAYVKIGSVEYVLSVLNSFNNNIKSTYEEEQNNNLLFLDVLFTRDCEKVDTSVYRKDLLFIVYGEELLKDQLIIAVNINNRTYFDMH